jgi:hypothetical protein
MENAVERDPRDSSNRVSVGLALRGNRIPQGGLVHFVITLLLFFRSVIAE